MALPEEKASPSFTGSTRPLSSGVIKYLCLSLPKKSDKSDFYTRRERPGRGVCAKNHEDKAFTSSHGCKQPSPPTATTGSTPDSQRLTRLQDQLG